MNTEVTIVGKGIAGLILSSLLERKGINHILLSRKDERKSLVFGETLPPSAMPLLHFMGLYDLFERLSFGKTRGYHSIWGRELVTDYDFKYDQSSNHGLKIDKAGIIHFLENEQLESIQQFSRITQLDPTPEQGLRIQFDSDSGTKSIITKYIVDATGKNRAVVKLLGIDIIRQDLLSAYSCHLPEIKFDQLPFKTLVESFENGWGIVSGLHNGKNVMTLFTNNDNPFREHFKKYEDWPELLSETNGLKYFLTNSVAPKILGSDASSSTSRSVAGDNWFAVGDAALAFDPLSSHGIANAIYTVNKVANSLKNILSGNTASSTEASGYNQSIHAIYKTYQESRSQLYAQEQRWCDSPFWLQMRKNHLVMTDVEN